MSVNSPLIFLLIVNFFFYSENERYLNRIQIHLICYISVSATRQVLVQLGGQIVLNQRIKYSAGYNEFSFYWNALQFGVVMEVYYSADGGTVLFLS